MSQIYYFQNLMVRYARMHKTRCYVNSEPETRKSASPFKPAGYIIGKGDFFFRYPQNHLARLYDYIAAVFNMNMFRYILKKRTIFYVIDLRMFFKDPEIITQRKIN